MQTKSVAVLVSCLAMLSTVFVGANVLADDPPVVPVANVQIQYNEVCPPFPANNLGPGPRGVLITDIDGGNQFCTGGVSILSASGSPAPTGLWIDQDADGVQDAGETIPPSGTTPGVKITFFAGPAAGAPPAFTGCTGAEVFSAAAPSGAVTGTPGPVQCAQVGFDADGDGTADQTVYVGSPVSDTPSVTVSFTSGAFDPATQSCGAGATVFSLPADLGEDPTPAAAATCIDVRAMMGTNEVAHVGAPGPGAANPTSDVATVTFFDGPAQGDAPDFTGCSGAPIVTVGIPITGVSPGAGAPPAQCVRVQVPAASLDLFAGVPAGLGAPSVTVSFTHGVFDAASQSCSASPSVFTIPADLGSDPTPAAGATCIEVRAALGTTELAHVGAPGPAAANPSSDVATVTLFDGGVLGDAPPFTGCAGAAIVTVGIPVTGVSPGAGSPPALCAHVVVPAASVDLFAGVPAAAGAPNVVVTFNSGTFDAETLSCTGGASLFTVPADLGTDPTPAAGATCIRIESFLGTTELASAAAPGPGTVGLGPGDAATVTLFDGGVLGDAPPFTGCAGAAIVTVGIPVTGVSPGAGSPPALCAHVQVPAASVDVFAGIPAAAGAPSVIVTFNSGAFDPETLSCTGGSAIFTVPADLGSDPTPAKDASCIRIQSFLGTTELASTALPGPGGIASTGDAVIVTLFDDGAIGEPPAFTGCAGQKIVTLGIPDSGPVAGPGTPPAKCAHVELVPLGLSVFAGVPATISTPSVVVSFNSGAFDPATHACTGGAALFTLPADLGSDPTPAADATCIRAQAFLGTTELANVGAPGPGAVSLGPGDQAIVTFFDGGAVGTPPAFTGCSGAKILTVGLPDSGPVAGAGTPPAQCVHVEVPAASLSLFVGVPAALDTPSVAVVFTTGTFDPEAAECSSGSALFSLPADLGEDPTPAVGAGCIQVHAFLGATEIAEQDLPGPASAGLGPVATITLFDGGAVGEAPDFTSCSGQKIVTIVIPSGATDGPGSPPAQCAHIEVPDASVDVFVGVPSNALGGLLPPPQVSRVLPLVGSTSQDTDVVVTGDNFRPGATVTFGAADASDGSPDPHEPTTKMTSTAPADGGLGYVSVIVTNVDGSIGVAPANSHIFYYGAPVVTGLNVRQGPIAGGQAVTITGAGFDSKDVIVHFGNLGVASGSKVAFVDWDQITVVTPAVFAGGLVPITVETRGGTSTPGSCAGAALTCFTYIGAPGISGLSPAFGPVSAGTLVTISGSQLATADGVTFGGVAGTGLVTVSDSQLSVHAPAHAVGPVPVIVHTSGGSSVPATYGYVGAPCISAIAPTEGRLAGGDVVTIQGSNFYPGAGGLVVKFGAVSVSPSASSPGTLQVTSPAGTGSQALTLVTASGQVSAIGCGADVPQPASFSYRGVPVIDGATPLVGATSGGTPVTISGTNFQTGNTVVSFGGQAATINTITDSQLFVLSPSGGSGIVDLKVITPGGTSNAEPFQYVVLPTVTGVSPAFLPTSGGTSRVVSISGSGFQNDDNSAPDVSSVCFGAGNCVSSASLITVASNSLLTVSAPSSSVGVFHVLVTNSKGQSLPVDQDRIAFSNGATTVTGVSPASDATVGGRTVTIEGTGFLSGATVQFDTASATGVTWIDGSHLQVTAPAHAVGLVGVTVTEPDSSANTATLASAFEYVQGPVVSGISPATGPSTGGTAVTITGSSFQPGAVVLFGGVAATSASGSGTSLSAIAPAHSAGQVSLAVVNPDGFGSTLANAFTYTAPASTSSSSSSGSSGGGGGGGGGSSSSGGSSGSGTGSGTGSGSTGGTGTGSGTGGNTGSGTTTPPASGITVTGVSSAPEGAGVRVTWTVAGPASVVSHVEYGVTLNYGGRTGDQPGPGTFSQLLDGFASGATIQFRIVAQGPAGEPVLVTGSFLAPEVAGALESGKSALPSSVSEGEPMSFSYTLPPDASAPVVQFVDGDGKVVKEVPLVQDPVTGLWTASTEAPPKGDYHVRLAYSTSTFALVKSDQGAIHSESTDSGAALQEHPGALVAGLAGSGTLIGAAVYVMRRRIV